MSVHLSGSEPILSFAVVVGVRAISGGRERVAGCGECAGLDGGSADGRVGRCDIDICAFVSNIAAYVNARCA